LFALSETVNKLRESDGLGILDPSQKKSNKEAEMVVRAHFLDTGKVNDKGRHEALDTLWSHVIST
jgi:hypothetical protein